MVRDRKGEVVMPRKAGYSPERTNTREAMYLAHVFNRAGRIAISPAYKKIELNIITITRSTIIKT